MRKLSILFWTLLLCITTIAKNSIKVACIGNSITYGAFISNPGKNSYPAQLQAYLGHEYEVRNFGVSGRTLLSKGNLPYIQTNEFKESQQFQPDIVLIKLGTNDTKPENWRYKDEFINDYQALINTYQKLESHPRIILITPLRCFLPEENSISGQAIENEVRPMVEKLAWKNKLEIINLFNVFGDKWEEHILPDKLHPSSIGAGIIAKKIGNYLTLTSHTKVNQTSGISGLDITAKFNFHGYQGYEFNVKGIACKIVRPSVEAKGKPWILRARFWGHEPQTDIDMLEQGFHIAYCDVAELYGSDKAVQRWNYFYKSMVKAGFNKKVVLEGMSRGGLIVYNWAIQNPEKIACIYADAPVMDFKSWPMAQGKLTKYAYDIQQLLTTYGFANETEALQWNCHSIHKCAHIMAKAKIPILHVVGDADDVVPVSENTTIFEYEMKALNAPITVIHKPGVGHHPHSLNNPEPIVRFILAATGRLKNECIHAVPGNEYRSGAGWIKESEWHSVTDDIKESLTGKQLKLLLLGNSITQGWGGTRKAVVYKPGKQAMDEQLGEGTWESAGISGDCTQNLLWRIRYDNYNRCNPQNVVIAIGINNLISGKNSPEEVVEGIIAITNESYKQFPNSRIILLGLLPSGKEKQSDIRKKCDKIHESLHSYKFKKAEYINPTEWFLDSNGTIRDGFYGEDYIHLTSEGYKILAQKIANILK